MDTKTLIPADPVPVKTGGGHRSTSTQQRIYYAIIIIIILVLVGIVVYKYMRPAPPAASAAPAGVPLQPQAQFQGPVPPGAAPGGPGGVCGTAPGGPARSPYCYEDMSQYVPMSHTPMRPIVPRPTIIITSPVDTHPVPVSANGPMTISTIDDAAVPEQPVSPPTQPLLSGGSRQGSVPRPKDTSSPDPPSEDVAAAPEQEDFSTDPIVMMTIEDDALSVSGQ